MNWLLGVGGVVGVRIGHGRASYVPVCHPFLQGRISEFEKNVAVNSRPNIRRSKQAENER